MARHCLSGVGVYLYSWNVDNPRVAYLGTPEKWSIHSESGPLSPIILGSKAAVPQKFPGEKWSDMSVASCFHRDLMVLELHHGVS